MRRNAVPAAMQHRMQSVVLPAPARGWILSENLSTASPAGARVLDNWFPTTTGARVRGGAIKWATVAEDAPVLSMWSYNGAAAEKFFAADETNIFDITTVADPDAVPSADVSSQTAGYYSTAQIATAGGDYLYAVNGADDALLYDGTNWTAINSGSTPSITGVNTDTFSHVWVYANKLFFIEGGSMRAWYLPVDSIGGAANSVSMTGIFEDGGALLFGATWSLDAGDGLDDKCVFVSTKGEVAVYEGTDPSDASNWSKVGKYRITAPMGQNGTMSAGGDLLIAVEDGIVPLSEAVRKDIAALSLASVTRDIEPAWKTEVVARRSLPWEIIKWPSNNMMIVSQPIAFDGQDAQCLVANLETGAWCRFTGWDTRCIAIHNNFGYFGSSAGIVYQMEAGGSDDGTPYTAVYVGQFEHLGAPGLVKTVQQARSVFLAASPFNAKVSGSVDYGVSLPSSPSSVADFTADEWDSGEWDVALWDAAVVQSVQSRWSSIGKTGYTFAPQLQITCGVTPKPRIELVSFNLTYTSGAVVA